METKTKIGVGIAGIIIGGATVFTLVGNNAIADTVCTKDVNGEVTCTTEVVSKQDYTDLELKLARVIESRDRIQSVCDAQVAAESKKVTDLQAIIDQVK